MTNKIFAGCIGIIAGLLIFYVFYDMKYIDNIGPVITIGNEINEYRNEMTDEDLLSDVTAVDDNDGDVSDSLIIKSIVESSNNTKVTITYAAKDSSNNISLKKRIVDLVGNFEEIETKEIETESTETETEETEETTENSENVSEDGINEAEVDATGIPAIELKSKELTLAVGSEFNVLGQVLRTYDDGGKSVSKRIQAVGEYNMSVPGDYTILYYVTDEDGNTSEKQTFILHVE